VLPVGRRSHLLVVAAIFASAGCQAQTSDVSGQVTKDGKPVVFGSVVLFPPGQSPIVVVLDEEGHYSAPRIPAGREVRVAVYSPDPLLELPSVPPGPEGDRDRVHFRNLRKKWSALPPRYNDPGQSGLALQPTGPQDTFDIRIDP